MLWMYQRVIFGKVTRPENQNLRDLSTREKLVLIPLVILIFWIGIYPKPFFERIEPAVRDVLIQIGVEPMRAEENQATRDQVTFKADESQTVDVIYSNDGGAR